MANQLITAPDGEVYEFPAEMPDEQIREIMFNAFPNINPARDVGDELDAIDEEFGDEMPFGEKIAQKFSSLKQSAEAGLQSSVGGLVYRGELPDVEMPENAGLLDIAAFSIGQEIGDLPATVAGGIAGATGGAVAGSAVPIAGTAVGGGLGGMAGAVGVPEGIRAGLMRAYEIGEVDTFGEYWDIVKAGTVEGAKFAAVGMAGGALGEQAAKRAGTISKVVNSKVAAKVVEQSAQTTGAVTGMVAAQSAIEGRMPTKEDFVNGAVTMVALKGLDTTIKTGADVTTTVAKKMRNSFASQGVSPARVAFDSQTDLRILEDALGDRNLFRSYEGEPKIIPTSQIKPADVTKPTFLSDMRRNFIDRYEPLRQMVKDINGGKEPDAAYNSHKQFLLLSGMDTVVENIYRNGIRNPDGSQKAEGVFKALKDNRGQLEAIDRFLAYSRAREKAEQGIDTGFDPAFAKDFVDKAPKAVRETAQKVTNLAREAMITYGKDTGLFSQKEIDAILAKNQHYATFHRIVDATSDTSKTGPKVSNTKLKEMMTGSQKDIISPIEATLRNVQVLVNTSAQNQARLQLVDDAIRAGKAEKVSKSKKVKISKAEIEKSAGQEIDIDTKVVEVFRKDRVLNKNEIEVWRDGKSEVYRLDTDLAEAITIMPSSQSHWALKAVGELARLPAKVARLGTVLSPVFQLYSGIRGELSAFANSPNGYVPILGLMNGLTTYVHGRLGLNTKRAQLFQRFVNEGGLVGSLTALHTDFLKNNTIDVYRTMQMHNAFGKDMKQNIAYINSAAKGLLSAPLRASAEIGMATELGPRIEQFRLSLKAGASGKEAAFQAKDIAVNFSQQPATRSIAALYSMTAFLGPTMQGLDKLGRQIAQNPKGTITKAAAVTLVPTIMEAVTSRFIATEDGYEESDWYKALPKHRKALFWNFRVGENTLSIPKGFDTTLMTSNLMSDYISYAIQEDQGFGDVLVAESLANIFPVGVQTMMPNFARPFMEMSINERLYTGAPLIPDELREALPAEQFTPYTTSLAKSLSKALTQNNLVIANGTGAKVGRALSPIMIENIVTNWSGRLGREMLQSMDSVLQDVGVVPEKAKISVSLADVAKDVLADFGITKKPDVDVRMADLPIIKAFIQRHPPMGAQPIVDFYQEYSTARKLTTSIDKAVKDMRLADATYYQDQLSRLTASFPYESFAEVMSAQNDMIEMIIQIPKGDIDPAERRQLVESLYETRVSIALEAVEAAKVIRKRMEELLKETKGQ